MAPPDLLAVLLKNSHPAMSPEPVPLKMPPPNSVTAFPSKVQSAMLPSISCQASVREAAGKALRTMSKHTC